MYINEMCVHYAQLIYIQRGLQCCLFGFTGNARASDSGTATVGPRFLYIGSKPIPEGVRGENEHTKIGLS